MKIKRLCKQLGCIVLLTFGLGSLWTPVWAVPAYPGWMEMTQPDSTTIELRLIGDEFYHYWINREGKEVQQNDDGWWVEVKNPLTPEQRSEIFENNRKRREEEAHE